MITEKMKRSLLHLTAILTIGFVFYTTGHCLDESGYPVTPHGVITAFCKSDYQGDALSSQTWPRLQQYTTWEDAPGWDKVLVVTEYKIDNERITGDNAEIAVKYSVVATLEAGEKSSDVVFFNEKENVLFKLQEVGRKWKIVEPQPSPHISVTKAIEILENEAKHAKDKDIAAKQHSFVKALKARNK